MFAQKLFTVRLFGRVNVNFTHTPAIFPVQANYIL